MRTRVCIRILTWIETETQKQINFRLYFFTIFCKQSREIAELAWVDDQGKGKGMGAMGGIQFAQNV